MSLGERIKKSYKAKGFSRTAFAKKLQISEATLSQWTSDNFKPRPKNIPLIAELCNVSESWLLTGSENNFPKDDTNEKVLLKLVADVDDLKKRLSDLERKK